jgi:hypothetical protein
VALIPTHRSVPHTPRPPPELKALQFWLAYFKVRQLKVRQLKVLQLKVPGLQT